MAGSASDLTIERIRVGDLPEFARRVLEDPARYPVVPITRLRADSQARNPAASADDTGLLVATVGGVCVGYLGLMPARVADGQDVRTVNCLTTFFVAPAHRKTGAGSLLIMKAVSLGRDLCVAGVSDDAVPIFKAMRFATAGPLICHRLRIDALPVLSFALGEASRWLSRRRLRLLCPVLDMTRSALRGSIDAVLRPLLLRHLIGRLRVPGEEIAAVPTFVVESPPGGGPAPAGTRAARFLRDDTIVNWMIRHPWIEEGTGAPIVYEFSHQRDRFRYLPFDLRDPVSGARLGYAVLSVSSEKGRTVIKVLDRVTSGPVRLGGILALALREALRWSADILEVPDEFAPCLGRSWIARAVIERVERRHLSYTRNPEGPFGTRLKDFQPDVCDGDAPFV